MCVCVQVLLQSNIYMRDELHKWNSKLGDKLRQIMLLLLQQTQQQQQ